MNPQGISGNDGQGVKEPGQAEYVFDIVIADTFEIPGFPGLEEVKPDVGGHSAGNIPGTLQPQDGGFDFPLGTDGENPLPEPPHRMEKVRVKEAGRRYAVYNTF
jgi:hypothetical protein